MRESPIKVEVVQNCCGNNPVIDLRDGTEISIEGYKLSLRGNVLWVRGFMSALIYPTIGQIRKYNDYSGGCETVGIDYKVSCYRINCWAPRSESMVSIDLDHVCSDPNLRGVRDQFNSGISRIHFRTRIPDHFIPATVFEIYYPPTRRL